MNRPCLRHLERRYEVLPGISLVDLAICLVLGLLGMALLHWSLGLIVGFGAFFFLKFIHEGKPRGYLFLLAYRMGLLARLPDSFRPPGLVPAPRFIGKRKRRYSSVAAAADDACPESRLYFSGKDLIS